MHKQTQLDTTKIFLNKCWNKYAKCIPNLDAILLNKQPIIDHIAIIDLPSAISGISTLKEIFQNIGYSHKGSGYLPDKINDFIWLNHEKNIHIDANKAIPQIVCADFRINLLSKKAQTIIKKYTSHIQPFNFSQFEKFCSLAAKGFNGYTTKAADLIFNYIYERPWPIPSGNDYKIINSENPLIAWVLLFGRKINHFGLSIHFYEEFDKLSDYNNHLKQHKLVEFNISNGEIKGNHTCGIEQSSSMGQLINIKLIDETIIANDSFIEFVWRHSIKAKAKLWLDYYKDFIPQNANSVVESLFTNVA